MIKDIAKSVEPKRFVSVEGGDHNTLVDDIGFDNYYSLVKNFVDGGDLSAKEGQ